MKRFDWKTAAGALVATTLLALPVAAQSASGNSSDPDANPPASTNTNDQSTTNTITNTTTSDTTNGTLPRTASPIPLVALVGAGLLGGAGALRMRRYRHS